MSAKLSEVCRPMEPALARATNAIDDINAIDPAIVDHKTRCGLQLLIFCGFLRELAGRAALEQEGADGR